MMLIKPNDTCYEAIKTENFVCASVVIAKSHFIDNTYQVLVFRSSYP